MVYLLPSVTVAMLGYMFWLLVFRLRRDRVVTERVLTRGKFAFRPKDRVRFLLNRAFHVSDDKPEWEDPLVGRLAELVPDPAEKDKEMDDPGPALQPHLATTAAPPPPQAPA